jgi:chemotaxis signal transduction protein
VLLRIDGALSFLPASLAVAVAPAPPVTRVAGAPAMLLGVAVHDGNVIPVLRIGGGPGAPAGRTNEPMLVCSYLGETLGLVGARIEGTGVYEVDPESPDAVRHAGERATTLDVASLYARVQGEGWAGRWRG